MNYIKMSCPNCKANLNVAEDRDEFYCEYCGCKIINHESRYSYTYKEINEARIHEADGKRDVRLRELELEIEAKKLKFKQRILILVIIPVICMLVLLCFDKISINEDAIHALTFICVLLLIGWVFYIISKVLIGFFNLFKRGKSNTKDK